MNIKLIQKFLADIAANNNRTWFQEHKAEYESAKQEFEGGVQMLLDELSTFDPEISHLTVKDCCYRFYRDVRFSSDKSPYKRHFGAYICAHGRKSLRGGYYLHIQPGHCLVAVGSYWLPTNILTAMRNEIMGNIDEWRKRVEDGKFIHYFGYPNASTWEGEIPAAEKGFGINCLKKAPKDFPKDYEFLHYLKMKDYCAWHSVDETMFEMPNWASKVVEICKGAKPMMDFVNSVVDDYE